MAEHPNRVSSGRLDADLVQRRIDQNGQNGEAIAFVDDYTAWVVGKTAAENHVCLQAIVQQATDWESRSGASFEGDKTAVIHFTRNSAHSSNGRRYDPRQASRFWAW